MPSEIDLAPADALQNSQMRAYAATPDTDVLLVRQQGQYRVLAARCPHYGAPLENGRIINDQIVCPWHHACFRVTDGHLCQPPALDDLPTYPVREADGRVWVTLPAQPTAAESPDVTPTALVGGTDPVPNRAAADPRTFVIVGAGAAGQFAAQTLRAEGFGGRIVLLGADPAAPYDRTKLSKAFLAGQADEQALPLRKPDFYARHQIELLTDTRATGLNLTNQRLTVEGREPLRYDKLLLAPGSQPNTLPKLPGHDLAEVLPLRSASDAEAIRQAATNARHVVIIGSSFIGMEVAASLAAENEAANNQARQITVVARDKEPFETVLGAEIGAMFRALHSSHGVRFEAEAQVEALEGENGRVTAVRLASGQSLPADLVVLGVGVRPATEFLAEVFALDKDGGLLVDAQLRAAEHVYVAGDVARFPAAAGEGRHRIEHWRLAQQHGACAARNMLGQAVVFAEVPFFWTQQYGKSLRYAGHAEEWDEIIFHGELAKQSFIALYAHQNRLLAAAGMGRDDDMLVIMELLRRGQMPAPTTARREIKWSQLLDHQRSE